MSSWLRSAISKATDVRGAPNVISRTVKSVAQHAGHAVAGGAKIVQERLVGRNLNSSKNAIKRLDEVAQTAKGIERVQALARWLSALKELGRDSKVTTEENRSLDSEDLPPTQDELTSPRRAAKVLFYDLDGDGEPMNFREIFLRSYAVENLVTSMILDAPTDEEVNLLSEIFGLCLVGGKELHNAIISSIQDLAKAFSSYNEEIMSKKEYLLQYARDAVNGLKLNADLERLEGDIVSVMQIMEEKKSTGLTKEDGFTKTKEMLQLDVHLRDLFQKKRLLILTGDSESARTEKVELLRTLSTSLKQSALDGEKHIEEYRTQKEAALKYRTTKAQEVIELEKTVTAEVRMLQQKKDDLEAQLKEVTAALAVAANRHINLQEEKQQFDEANTDVVGHLAAEEEELTRLIANQNVEASVIGTWISFLEDTWKLQSSCVQKVNEDSLNLLVELKEKFFKTLSMNLSYLQEELTILLEELKANSRAITEKTKEKLHIAEGEAANSDFIQSRSMLQERFLETEGQIVSILRNVEVLKEEYQIFTTTVPGSNDAGNNVMKAFDAIGEIRKDVEAIERPNVDDAFLAISPKAKPSLQSAGAVATSKHEMSTEATSDHEISAEEFFSNESSQEMIMSNEKTKTHVQDETEGWEFDELEELRKDDT